MLIEPEIAGVSLVTVGNLNPKIFTPDWFARNDLIEADEAEASEVEFIHPELSRFRTDWFDLLVQPDRFQIQTSSAPYIRICDLFVKTFKDFLIHTPLTRLGINFSAHFDVGSVEKRNQIGELLAPKAAWGEWGELLNASPADQRANGMRILVMEQQVLSDRKSGHIQAKIEPSLRIKGGISGIYMEVNDQYDASTEATGALEIVNLAEAKFDASLKRSQWIIDQIMRLRDAA